VLSVLYIVILRLLYTDGIFHWSNENEKYILAGIYAVLSWVLINNLDGFQIGDLRRLDMAVAQWIGLFIVNFITYFQLCLIAKTMINVWPMIILMAIEVVVVVGFVYLYTAIYYRLYPPYRMIMICGSEEAVGMKLKMDHRYDKYMIQRMISIHLGVDRICEEIHRYDAVVINDVPAQMRNDILKYCYQNDIRTYVVPKITDVIMRGAHNVSIFDTPLLVVRNSGLNVGQRFAKRTMDIVLSLIALIVAAPIMLVTAIAIKLEDHGPVFFTQKRATIGGKEFDILKFRSMIVDAEKGGFSIPATGQDPRITKVGRIIRACRVDELPQIINILKGDMSIVGPRPERLEHVQKYSESIPEFAFRLKVKGGLTGYAQIYGKYNTSAYDKLRLDLMYIENYSFLLDIKLILMTIRVMLSKESTEGFEKADEFERLKKEMLSEVEGSQYEK